MTEFNKRAYRTRASIGSGWFVAAVFLCFFQFVGSALAAGLGSEDPYIQRYSVNDFGGVGLIQTPTARFSHDGEFYFGASFVKPYRRYFLTWQVLPFLEATFRYFDPTNSDYGGVNHLQYFYQDDWDFYRDLFTLKNGNTRLGREADLKIRLFKEGYYMPQVAIGLRDFIGTSDFSGEYIVATKRVGNFDISLGYGWGHLGNRGGLPNPLAILGDRFKTRIGSGGLGGTAQFGRWFSGNEGGVFGGVEYFSDWKNVSVKVEFSGSKPELEQDIYKSPNLGEDFPIYLAVNYQPASWVDIALGWERGNSLMLRANFRTNLNNSNVNKTPDIDPPVAIRETSQVAQSYALVDPSPSVIEMKEHAPLPTGTARVQIRTNQVLLENKGADVSVSEFGTEAFSVLGGISSLNVQMGGEVSTLEMRRVQSGSSNSTGIPGPDASEQDIINRLLRALLNARFFVKAIDLKDQEAIFYVGSSKYRSMPRNAGRLGRLVTAHLPRHIEKITYVEQIEDFDIVRMSVMRSDIEREALGLGSAEEIWRRVEIETPLVERGREEPSYVQEVTYPGYIWWITPELQQHIGDPSEGVWIADLDAEVGISASLLPGLSLRAILRQFLFGNLKDIKRSASSVLPHVRSDIRNYLQGGNTTISQLQLDYIAGLAPNWYARIAAGIFEDMYGGVGAEVLYRPWGERWAVSVEMDWVKQRHYKQLLGFRDYEVLTGHATVHYDLPFFGLRSSVSVGRYLAGDRGATFELSRRFDNGIRVGAWATFTNVSAADFGEGSFDKGFYIKFPMELFLMRNTKEEAYFGFRPLSRDGGQKVNVGPSMFDLVDRGSLWNIKKFWRDVSRR